MEYKVHQTNVALVIGVTGMTGLSLAEALKNPAALGAPWKVYGTARGPTPPWFPSSVVDGFISFDALNSDDTLQKLSPISSQVTHLFWLALQIRETEESNVEVNSTMLQRVFKSRESTSKLRHVTLQTGTKHYMGPIFDPVLGTKLVNHEPPFNEEMPRLPYPNFYYALEDVLADYVAGSKTTSYSVHRASRIIGASSRSFYNMLLTLSVYAEVCRYENLPFRYPGTRYTWEHFCDASDARVLAKQHIWAAVTERAKNQAFNCTNGDVFTWKSLWKVLCGIFGLEFVPFDDSEEFDWVGMMKEKGSVWDQIVEKYGLHRTKMEEITCFEASNMALHLGFQHVCSVNKSREFGFYRYADTLKCLPTWVGRLRDMKIIP